MRNSAEIVKLQKRGAHKPMAGFNKGVLGSIRLGKKKPSGFSNADFATILQKGLCLVAAIFEDL